jgi:hypothetical protein
MKTFYWDSEVHCYDCVLLGRDFFWTWTDDKVWDNHGVSGSDYYTLGDIEVPDTCLILNQVPVADENFL